jgi:hypothetical protein
MRSALLGLVVLMVLLLEVERAAACSCPQPEITSPLPDATDVPLNAALVVEYHVGFFGLALRNAATQAVVPLELEPFGPYGWNQFAVARPTANLEPNTRYEVVSGATYPLSSFTTGETIDTTPPGPHELRSMTARNIEAVGAGCFDCNRTDHVDIRLQYTRDSDVVFSTYELYPQDDPGSAIVAIQNSNFPEYAFCTALVPPVDASKTYCARVTVYDIAGNTSVSNEVCTQPEECKLVDTKDCRKERECKPASSAAPGGGGCTTGGTSGGWFLAVLLALVTPRWRCDRLLSRLSR